MKSRLLVYILMMFSFAAISQEVASPCMVYMKAKQNTELLQQPELFLSKRSLARRARQAITVSNSDLPIEAHRLQTVSHVVSKIGNSSRWLNAVYHHPLWHAFRGYIAPVFTAIFRDMDKPIITSSPEQSFC